MVKSHRPFSWIDENGQPAGLVVEDARNLALKAAPSARIKLILYPAERAVHAFLRKEMDILYGGFSQPPITAVGIAIGKLAEIEIELWHLAGNDQSLADLLHGDLYVADPFGTLPELKESNKTQFPAGNNLIAMLAARRIPAIVDVGSFLILQVKRLGLDARHFVRHPLTTLDAFVWIHKESAIHSDLQLWRSSLEAQVQENNRVEKTMAECEEFEHEKGVSSSVCD